MPPLALTCVQDKYPPRSRPPSSMLSGPFPCACCATRVLQSLNSHSSLHHQAAPHDALSAAQKDKADLLFGARMKVDFVFASFIRNAQQVREVRAALGGYSARIISKIENEEGLDNIDEVREVPNSTGVGPSSRQARPGSMGGQSWATWAH